MIHIEDNKWVRFSKKDNLVCCDCSLAHKLEFKVINGVIYIKLTRDDISTNKYRKGKKAKQTIKDIAKAL